MEVWTVDYVFLTNYQIYILIIFNEFQKLGGGGALPPSSFFERLTIELAAFTKA